MTGLRTFRSVDLLIYREAELVTYNKTNISEPHRCCNG